jgi:hypothetical protein
MALSGWLSKCPITISGSRIPATATNLPILLIESNFNSAIFGASGCAVDGRDIRFSLDSDGEVELPREIVDIDKALSKLSIYVKIPTLTASTNLVIYSFWNNSSADEPGRGSASEARLVWSDYYGVFHFQDMLPTWKGIRDSAGNWSNMSSIGVIANVVGHAPSTVACALGPTFGITLHEFINFANTTQDFMFWCNFNGTASSGNVATGTNGIPFGWLAAGQWGIGWGLTSTTSGAVPSTGWHHVWMRVEGGVCRIYVNGLDRTQGPGTAGGVNFNTFGTGTSTSPVFRCSELRRTRDFNNSVANVQVMVSNESNPAIFCSSGVVETVSVSNTLTFTGLKPNTEVRIYQAGTTTELAGVENSTTTFSWDFSSVQNIDIAIHNIQYEYIRYENFALVNSNITIPVQQRIDRNFLNPT